MDQDQIGEQPKSGGEEAEGTSWVFDPSSAWVVTPLFPCNLVEKRMMIYDSTHCLLCTFQDWKLETERLRAGQIQTDVEIKSSHRWLELDQMKTYLTDNQKADK